MDKKGNKTNNSVTYSYIYLKILGLMYNLDLISLRLRNENMTIILTSIVLEFKGKKLV